MSRARQQARAARQQARAAEVAAAARRRERAERRTRYRALLPRPRRRPRRFGALTTRQRYEIAVAFLVVQAVAWVFLASMAARLCVAVLTVAVLLVVVTTRRSPSR